MSAAVFLTGGSGFLGGRLAEDLRASGRAVHALVRASSQTGRLTALGCTLHAGELRDRASLARALAAACAGGARPWVVHSAALISYRTRDGEVSRAINVEGTRNLLEACAQQPIGRFLHISSVVAVGCARSLAELPNEDAPFDAGHLGVHYVATKRAAEELALAFARALDVVVVNPGAIFGSGSRGANTLRFLNLVARGKLGPLAPPGSIAPVGVEDVSRGCILALERGERGRRYILAESALSLVDSFRLAARLFGRPGVRGAFPRPLWRAIVAGAAALDRVRPLDVLTPQALRCLGHHFAYDSSRARSELGWKPEAFESVLGRTITWARRAGLVP